MSGLSLSLSPDIRRPLGMRGSGDAGRSTKPKVTGSNPVGRVLSQSASPAGFPLTVRGLPVSGGQSANDRGDATRRYETLSLRHHFPSTFPRRSGR